MSYFYSQGGKKVIFWTALKNRKPQMPSSNAHHRAAGRANFSKRLNTRSGRCWRKNCVNFSIGQPVRQQLESRGCSKLTDCSRGMRNNFTLPLWSDEEIREKFVAKLSDENPRTMLFESYSFVERTLCQLRMWIKVIREKLCLSVSLQAHRLLTRCLESDKKKLFTDRYL